MKILLDTCIWGGAQAFVRNRGHDVVWAGDWREDPGDEEILNRAHMEGRVLATLDKDFGELAVFRGIKHSGIVRIVGFPAREQGKAICAVLEKYGDLLGHGSIIILEIGRVRVRPPEAD
jgi:predicted nuclease of predicted toxin-antitoxin system